MTASRKRLLAAALPLALAVTVAGALPAAAQEKKPNILLIVSDDTGYGDLGPYRRREPRHADAQHRQARRRRHDVLLLLRPAELHAGSRGDADRPHPEPQRHDDGRLPGPGRRPARGGVDAGLGAQEGGLQDLLHRQVASGRGRLRAAQRPGLRRDEVRRSSTTATPTPTATRTGSRTWIPSCARCSRR